MEAADEPLFQEVLSEVSCKSSNPLILTLFADRLELTSEEPKCCKGGRRSLDDGNRNIIIVPFDKIVGSHVLNNSMIICDEAGSERQSSHLGIYAFQEHFVKVGHERGKCVEELSGAAYTYYLKAWPPLLYTEPQMLYSTRLKGED